MLCSEYVENRQMFNDSALFKLKLKLPDLVRRHRKPMSKIMAQFAIETVDARFQKVIQFSEKGTELHSERTRLDAVGSVLK